jgi:hypothetical protein
MKITKKNFSIIIITYFWIYFTPFFLKLLSFYFSIGFAVVEFFFTGLIKNNKLCLQEFSLTKCYTTLPQFYANLIYIPLLITINDYFDFPYYLLIFPFNVWLCEIIVGNYIYYTFNIRVWHYIDNKSYFNGFITLNYFWYWLFLGCLFNLVLFFVKIMYLEDQELQLFLLNYDQNLFPNLSLI